jgi:ferrous iron transport protein B
LMFFFAINIGGIVQDYFQVGSNAIFVTGFAHLLTNWQFPNWLITILSTGLGKGINTTVTFIPVLTAMFIFLAILEGTGYMARAGFVIDRVMCAIGLPGKSFVPMLIGFGCNVPAIMAARTLENRRDRILTIMMTPFMSCSARLAIYAVFTAAFVPTGRQNIVFALYIIGILVAIVTGLILRKTILMGVQSSLIMELPPYHLPTIHDILVQTWCRLKSFICKAGKVIIPACIIIAALNTTSLLETAGHKITPVLKPMGIQQNNWPATVGLISGVAAKEIVVASLNTLYAKVNAKPMLRYKGMYGQMYERFAGQIGAFAYLLFVLLYFPCIPALATMFQELGWRWATFSMLWNTGIAYSVATVFYQAATFTINPVYAATSISIISIIFLAIVLTMRWIGGKK